MGAPFGPAGYEAKLKSSLFTNASTSVRHDRQPLDFSNRPLGLGTQTASWVRSVDKQTWRWNRYGLSARQTMLGLAILQMCMNAGHSCNTDEDDSAMTPFRIRVLWFGVTLATIPACKPPHSPDSEANGPATVLLTTAATESHPNGTVPKNANKLVQDPHHVRQEVQSKHGPTTKHEEHQQSGSGTHSPAHSTSGETHAHESDGHHAHRHKIVVTSVIAKDITATQAYVSQIRSCRHIEIRALEEGYLEEIPVKEGQLVQAGDLLFQILPPLYEARMEAEAAEAKLARIEYENARKLFEQKVVSEQEVALGKAKLDKAEAQMRLSQAEFGFTQIKAPFTGIIDRLLCQHGSLVSEGDNLTTLADNSVMWVYFNVPEAQYLDFMENKNHQNEDLEVKLLLANHNVFDQAGKIGAIEADFNNETGNIAFRADFPNPNGLLRNGQTGKVLLNRILHGATVIPQRATFEVLAKRYALVIDDANVVHQREITIEMEQEDIFVIKSGLQAGEKIVMEGVRQVRDGDKIEYEFRDPEVVFQQLKNRAE